MNFRSISTRRRVALAAVLLTLAAPLAWPAPAENAAAASFYNQPFEKQPQVAAMTAIGRQLFAEPRLSASGQQSCASCHDPQAAYGPANAEPVQRGGPTMRLQGGRAVPSLRYLQAVPPFTEHYFENDGDDSVDLGPVGGRTWDGRAASVHDQALLPLLSPVEMANHSAGEIVQRVRQTAVAEAMRNTFGAHLFDDERLAFNAVLLSLEVFQQSPADFAPYSSKYDAWLRGRATLSEAEQRGMAAFDDPRRGNCASCHPSRVRNGAFPVFSDFGFAALGAPRNRALAVNRDPAYFDLGLCGPLRTDLADRAEYCGMFRVPSLRNVAQRRRFFHNGVFSSLTQVLDFYATRDSQPGRWYPRGKAGAVQRFDDLPAAYQRNVERRAPFGTPVRLSEQDRRDIIAFLQTLSDGYAP